MEKTLSVTAINNGTVIDHIPAGQAITILRLLKLVDHKNQVTIGLNLSGNRGFKDLIKMENRYLTDREMHEIAIFAPNATINTIKDFKVIKKHKALLPESVIDIMRCPNPRCVTQNEPLKTCFDLYKHNEIIKLRCKYCEKTFLREEVKEYIA